MTIFDYFEYDALMLPTVSRGRGSGQGANAAVGAHKIRVDYMENKADNTYVLLFDMPGIEKKDIGISIEGNNVTVQAFVQALSDDEKWKASHK